MPETGRVKQTLAARTSRCDVRALKVERDYNVISETLHHRWSRPDLDYVSEVAVSSQLQALPLRPGLDGQQPVPERGSPVVGAQA